MKAPADLAAMVEAVPHRLAGAIAWARQGWPVLPCCPDGERAKSPLVAGGKDSATTDEAQIREWWAEFPNALVGGRTDGLVVLDFDAYKPGHADDLAALGELPATRTHRTPGRDGVRGRHLVYLDPDGECRSTKLGPHGTVDVRAGTSRDYVILPAPGGPYEVADARPPAAAPGWLLEAAGRSRETVETARDGLPPLEDMPPGTDVGPLLATGTDDPSVHTFRLIRNAKGAGLSPGQARTLAEDDEVTADRIGQARHSQPRWWPDEFWRCWDTSRPDVARGSYQSPRRVNVNDDPDEQPGKQSTAVRLVAIARSEYELGLMTGDAPFAVRRDGPNVARVFRGSKNSLRSELARAFESDTGRPPAQNALSEALEVLTGEARSIGTPADLPMRVARHGGELVLDLGDKTGRAVVVGPGGWKVVDRSPVLFLRTELTGELPTPVKGGKLSQTLFPLLNLPRADRALVTAILLSWLWPNISHPVPYLHGEEGTAKSTMARILRSLVDPSPVEVRRQPGRDEDWEVTIAGQWAVVLDNLSAMADWLSDALCTAVSGTGDVKRKKYSDQELSVLQVRRCFILTSIDASLATRGDLLDRTVLFELDPIGASRTEEELAAEWEQVRPRALGALLDLASAVLARLPDVLPSAYSDFRMADFARIAAAFDQATGARSLPVYRKKRADAVAGALESDPFAVELKDIALRGGFDGSVGDLFARHIGMHLTRQPVHPSWPKNPTTTGTRLRRLSGLLRKSGVAVTMYRDKKGKRCRIEAITDSTESNGTTTL